MAKEVKQSGLPNNEIASAEYGLAMTGRTIAAEDRRTMTVGTIAAEGGLAETASGFRDERPFCGSQISHVSLRTK